MTVTPMAAAASPQSTAAAVDRALLAWIEPDLSDDDDFDPLAIQATDELALLLIE